VRLFNNKGQSRWKKKVVD